MGEHWASTFGPIANQCIDCLFIALEEPLRSHAEEVRCGAFSTCSLNRSARIHTGDSESDIHQRSCERVGILDLPIIPDLKVDDPLCVVVVLNIPIEHPIDIGALRKVGAFEVVICAS